jgi:hypothetical protein
MRHVGRPVVVTVGASLVLLLGLSLAVAKVVGG